MKTMKSELDRKNHELADAAAEQNRLQSEVNHCKAEFLDMQRGQRATKVDLEQATKKVGKRVNHHSLDVDSSRAYIYLRLHYNILTQ